MPQEHPIVLIIGPTGSGKSEFINLFITEESDKLEVGGGMRSVTREVTSRIVPNPIPGASGVVELIDTPGLDDTELSDNMMFLKISQHLARKYKDHDHNVNGVILVRKMEDMRMTNTAIRQTNLFECFVGQNNFRNVLLLTSFWPSSETALYREYEEREVELLRDYWADMRRRQADYARFSNHDVEPARDAMYKLLRQMPFTLQVVDEMVNQGKRYEDTVLGKEADKHLEEVKAQAAEARKEVEEMKKLINTKDQMMQQMLENQRQQFSRTIETIEARQREAREADEQRYQSLRRELEERAATREREVQQQQQQYYQQQLQQQQQYYQQQQQQQPAPPPTYDTTLLLHSLQAAQAAQVQPKQSAHHYDDYSSDDDSSDDDSDSDDDY